MLLLDLSYKYSSQSFCQPYIENIYPNFTRDLRF
jgi:hypothetical protein